jgi:NAD-dependent SIR2 family protein deacetylase
MLLKSNCKKCKHAYNEREYFKKPNKEIISHKTHIKCKKNKEIKENCEYFEEGVI